MFSVKFIHIQLIGTDSLRAFVRFEKSREIALIDYVPGIPAEIV